MNTTKIRTKALESLVKCFNLCYPDWEIEGDSSQPLTEEHVEYSYCQASSRKLARLGWQQNGHITFAIDSNWYKEATRGERLGLLIHEIAHAKVSNHSPEFWEQTVENYKTLRYDYKYEVMRVMRQPFSWSDTKEFLVTDPLPVSVDHRSEVACDRRLTIANELDYPIEKFEPFKNMQIKTPDGFAPDYTEIPIWNISYQQKSLRDLIDCFYERPRKHLKKHGNRFVINRPVVRQLDDDDYIIVEGDERVAIAAYAGEKKIQCEVTEQPLTEDSWNKQDIVETAD